MARQRSADPLLLGWFGEIKRYGDLARKTYDQAFRRVIQGERVPAGQKGFSIFEDHAEIVIKDRRETHYGHKVCLTGGTFNLIRDCVILKGDPADTELIDTMLDRQKEIYGRYPLKVALDGRFASKGNRPFGAKTRWKGAHIETR